MSDITAREYRAAVKVAKECLDQSTVEYLERLAAKAEAEFVCPAYPHGEHECNTIPAETGPWHRYEDVPEGVKYRSSRPGSTLTFVNRGGVRFVSSTGLPDGYDRFAPFVAAEEGL